jgi:cellulose synthase/poly-beta-1,6-N-acetylglucosamine synthase-like glycosyltransferase
MRVSLLIATRDRCASLERCLEAAGLARAPGPLEVVVVDNGSRDGTGAFLADYARRAPFPLVALSEPRPGKSRALNTGLAQATGDVIALIDDDIYLTPDYFERLAGIFEREGVGYCGGRILLHDPTDLPMTLRTTTTTQLIPPGAFITPGEIQGCNMAFRREVLEAIGGFDPMLGPGTPFMCEDVDLAARASAAGWVGGYFPELVVYHHHGRKTPAQEAALVRDYSWGRGAYFTKFILDRRTRLQYLKRYYWHWRALPFRVLRQEVSGAVRYTLARLFASPQPTPRVAARPSDAARAQVKAG